MYYPVDFFCQYESCISLRKSFTYCYLFSKCKELNKDRIGRTVLMTTSFLTRYLLIFVRR